MNCIIVDDNKIARSAIAQLCKHVPGLEVMHACESAFDAFPLIKENQPDLLLLDIEMEGMSGIELTRNLGGQKPVIIFISSKKEYAVDAFELSVADYIVKPVSPARFIQAIDRAQEILESKKETATIQDDAFIFIRDSNVVRRLGLDQLLFAEAMGDYVKLVTAAKTFAIHNRLREVEQRLPASQFIRVHRSYIVAVDKIDRIEQGVLIVDGKTVPVADAYRNALNRRLNIL